MADDKWTIYVAPGDPLAARAINLWRANGKIHPDVGVATSETVEPGYGFLCPPLLHSIAGITGTIFKFDEPMLEYEGTEK